MRHWISRRAGVKRSASRLANRAHGLSRRLRFSAGYPLRVQAYRLSPPGWPSTLQLGIAALADLHYGGHYLDQARLRLIIDRSQALDADLIVLLGDYGASHLEGRTHRAAMRELAGRLSRLRAPLGVLAIMGNHDWWDDPAAQATGEGPVIAAQELSDAGITVLENQAVRLTRQGQPCWVAGLGDQLAHLGPPTTGDDDLAGLTAQLSDDAPALLLAHEPDIFPDVPDRYALTLSGHTHAGQIKILGRTPVVPSRYGSRYVHVEDGRHLIVSGGLGTSILPVRIGTQPEIFMIELGEGNSAR